MSGMNKYSLAAIVAVSGVMGAGSAWALVAAPIDVPEPGLFGIIATATAAVILAARLRNRK